MDGGPFYAFCLLIISMAILGVEVKRYRMLKDKFELLIVLMGIAFHVYWAYKLGNLMCEGCMVACF
jgi:hypothetical protein